MSRLDRAIDSRALEATIKAVRLGNRSDHWRHCVALFLRCSKFTTRKPTSFLHDHQTGWIADGKSQEFESSVSKKEMYTWEDG